MWIWTTIRRIKYRHENNEVPTGFSVLFGGGVKHVADGYTDHAALLDMENGTQVWERRADEDVPFDGLILTMPGDNSPLMLADTLDEFAAKVGASPRPQVEIPSAFKEAI